MYNHKFKFSAGNNEKVVDFLELKNVEDINVLEINTLVIVDIPDSVKVLTLELFLDNLYNYLELKDIVGNLSKELFKEN